MKSYTDIEQSKKLAEILPLESADMHYNNGSCRGVDYTEHFSAELMPYQEALHLMKIHKTNFMFQVIPCWSLAALLDIIPYPILAKHANETWSCVSWVEKMIPYFVEGCDSPINACYEMILKLHEEKLL